MTDKKEFNKLYGTHVVTGITRGCSLDVFFKQSCKSTDSKLHVVANLHVKSIMLFMMLLINKLNRLQLRNLLQLVSILKTMLKIINF